MRQKPLDVRFTAGKLPSLSLLLFLGLTIATRYLEKRQRPKWLQNEVTPFFGPKLILRISPVNFCDQPAFGDNFYHTLDELGHTWAGGEDKPWEVSPPLELEVRAFKPDRSRESQQIPEGFTTSPNTRILTSTTKLIMRSQRSVFRVWSR